MPEYSSPGVYIEEVPGRSKPIEGVPTSTTAFVGEAAAGPVREPVQVASFTQFQSTFGGLVPKAELGYAVRQFFQNGGTDARIVRVDDDGQVPGALVALNRMAPLGLLCLPGYVKRETLTAALAYCDRWRVFLVVDAPGNNAPAARELAGILRMTGSANGAVYFPRLSVADPLANNAPRSSPPSGAVAGVIARTDATRGVWNAPAGTPAHVTSTLGVEAVVDDALAASLQTAGVNPIRSIPGSGIVIWGARTISTDERWQHLPARRLLLYIETSLERGLQWAVSEPNTRRLWNLLAVSVTSFLARLRFMGALRGVTSDDAFFVKHGRDAMTPADVRAGRAILLVGFAPIMPSDFVVLRIVVVTRRRGGP